MTPRVRTPPRTPSQRPTKVAPGPATEGPATDGPPAIAPYPLRAPPPARPALRPTGRARPGPHLDPGRRRVR